MKFSSTDKISETVSLIRNKKIYFIGRNKYSYNKLLNKIECWPVFKQDPNNPFIDMHVVRFNFNLLYTTLSYDKRCDKFAFKVSEVNMGFKYKLFVS